jgi:uncharacterized protein (TIGR03437 family)
MKCLSLFLLSAALSAQNTEFATGQAARAVIGQTTFTSQDPNSSDVILGGVSGIAYANDTLFVADANRVGAFPSNHRVLLFQNLSGMLPAPTTVLVNNRKCPVCTGQATIALGQPDFTTTTEGITPTRSSLRLPTAVASDGVHLVVADTNHNRVLIWNRIPTTNNAQADVVVGQADFATASLPGNTPNAKSMRGPQGVWIQNGKLYVADTQNNRVLIYNRIPTSNGASADVVLGQPDFTTFVQPDLTQQQNAVTAQNLLNPVAVSSDGIHLFITDLGYNRVLIWNKIPTSNGTAADVVVGQPDMTSSVANYGFRFDADNITEVPVLCSTSNGTDPNNNNAPTYPAECNTTLNYPRFALSDGKRLFIADGGNDRVLIYNNIPTTNAAPADSILGQTGPQVNQASDAADSLRTPMSMAWDGSNLYVSDAFNRRVMVYSIAPTVLPYQAVVNAASLRIAATGQVTIALNSGATIAGGDSITITINSTDYSFTVKATDAIADIVTGLVNAINSANGSQGDPNVLAAADTTLNQVALTARAAGSDGNNITLSASVKPTTSQLTAVTSGATLSGGGDAASVAPGTVVSIIAANGTQFGSTTAAADPNQNPAPLQLAGVSVYFNGIPAPLFYVSPTKVNAQIPWEVNDTTSINAYVRTAASDGSAVATTPVAVSIVQANPGLFQQPDNAGVGVVYHASSRAGGIVDVQGSATTGDVATVTIEDRTYNYTVLDSDTLESIRDHLATIVNQDPKVEAVPSGVFTRIWLRARVEGPEGQGIPYTASANANSTLVMTAFTQNLCCANVEDAPVTAENPAIPGEFLKFYATGLGLPVIDDSVAPLLATGFQFPANGPNTVPQLFVSSLAGGKTADVITATLMPGMVGTYLVILHLNPDIPTNNATPVTISQDIYTSNVVTFPVVNTGVVQ